MKHVQRSDRRLVAIYALIAVVALYATWSNNLEFFAMPHNGGLAGFVRHATLNPAARSLTNDLGCVCLAAFVFMLVEAQRLRIRFVWVYILLSLLVAISVMFPLFLIARQIRLAEWTAEHGGG